MATQKAPGTLEIVQDFVNTEEIDPDHVSDEIDGATELGAWLAGRGLMSGGAPVSNDDLARAHELRGALRRLMAGNAGEEIDPNDLDLLTRAAAGGGVGPVFSSPGEVALEAAAEGVAGALGRIVGFVVDAIADGTWPRLKACLNDECHWAFYDSARNRSAKWCSMAVCGNRMKARAFRARHAESDN